MGHASTYQIYVRSFRGRRRRRHRGSGRDPRAKLPYLRRLGVDGVWLTPCFPSPQHDHGYDVADYLDIEPMYR